MVDKASDRNVSQKPIIDKADERSEPKQQNAPVAGVSEKSREQIKVYDE